MDKYKLWVTNKEEKIKQVEETPFGTEFYLFSTKWTNPLSGKKRKHDEFVKIWWRHNGQGYTYDLDEAGIYTREEILDRANHYCDESIYPLPKVDVDAGHFGKVMRSVYN